VSSWGRNLEISQIASTTARQFLWPEWTLPPASNRFGERYGQAAKSFAMVSHPKVFKGEANVANVSTLIPRFNKLNTHNLWLYNYADYSEIQF